MTAAREDKMHCVCGKGERSTLLVLRRVPNFSSPRAKYSPLDLSYSSVLCKNMAKHVQRENQARKQRRTSVVSRREKLGKRLCVNQSYAE